MVAHTQSGCQHFHAYGLSYKQVMLWLWLTLDPSPCHFVKYVSIMVMGSLNIVLLEYQAVDFSLVLHGLNIKTFTFYVFWYFCSYPEYLLQYIGVFCSLTNTVKEGTTPFCLYESFTWKFIILNVYVISPQQDEHTCIYKENFMLRLSWCTFILFTQ